jgi:sterol desaturase/sphingolipid hydroxylase (fatty acid hydroxylase superfamily)
MPAIQNLPEALILLGLASVVGGVLFAAERVYGNPKRPVLRRGFFADLIYGPTHVAMRLIVNGSVAVALSEASAQLLPQGWAGLLRGQSVAVQSIVLLLTLDLIFYGTHRLKHRFDWWWRLHETHHSSVDLDFLSSVRFHPLEKALDRILYLVPLVVLGPSPEAAIIWACCDVFFGLVIHSNLPLRIGPLKYVFCSPEMHRWHHTPDARMQRVNLANNFALFDWIFGTAFVSSEEPTDFGIAEPDYPHENPLLQFSFAFRRRRHGAESLAANSGREPATRN